MVVSTAFDSNWYYALDDNGQRIPFPGGKTYAAGGYYETTAIDGMYFKDMNSDFIGFAAPIRSSQAAALGLPFINSNSILGQKTLVVTTSGGRQLEFPVVERSGAANGLWEFTYGGAKLLNGESIVRGEYR